MPDVSADPRIEGIRQLANPAHVRDMIAAYDELRETADQYNAAVNSLGEDNDRLGAENETLRKLTAILRVDLVQMSALRTELALWKGRVETASRERDRLAVQVAELGGAHRDCHRQRDALAAQVQRAQELHVERADSNGPYCASDGEPWPCKTTEALSTPDAEQPEAGQ
jgi:uncharacterized coiled-coil DUF342 family protein